MEIRDLTLNALGSIKYADAKKKVLFMKTSRN